MNIKPWIQAARLRTLPLAFSCILTGAAIAIQQDKFNYIILVLALFTTLLLQILSNYANDYGDALSGKDENRTGEKRMVTSGEITPQAMKKALYISTTLAFLSGLALIVYSFDNYIVILSFLLLGIAAIWASIKYTAGKNPYGYSGYGDFFVFLFFGIVGVMGSTFLFTQLIYLPSILPAISIGSLSVAVLTLNNLRDIKNDAKTGKNTVIVKIGFNKGKAYFASLILIALVSMIAYAILTHFENRQYVFLLVAIFLSNVIKKVLNTNKPEQMDPFLKKVALSTFALSILFLVAMAL